MTADRVSLEAWSALWRRLGARSDPAPAHGEIHRAYSEPHRHYHTLEHIAHALGRFDDIRSRVGAADAAELALWLHDFASGRDTAIDANSFSAAVRSDGAIAYVRGTDVYRAFTTYAGDVVVRSSPSARPVIWSTEPAAYVAAAWAGNTLLAYRIGEGERLVPGDRVLVALHRHELPKRLGELVHRGLQTGIVEGCAEELLELRAHVR